MKRSFNITFGSVVASVTVLGLAEPTFAGEDTSISPRVLRVDPNSGSQDVRATVRLRLPEEYTIDTFEIFLRFEDAVLGSESVVMAKAISVEYDVDNGVVLVDFDRAEILEAPYVDDFRGRDVLAILDGWFTATNGSNIFQTELDGFDCIEVR